MAKWAEKLAYKSVTVPGKECDLTKIKWYFFKESNLPEACWFTPEPSNIQQDRADR